MKLIYLLRHAKSSWADPDLEDLDRPLAPRGRQGARKMARHLRQAGIAPALVLCSPARRARETLELVSRGLGKKTEVRVEDWLYSEGAEELLRRLRRLPDDVSSVVLVGHNPSLQELALALTGRGEGLEHMRAKFPTGALATLSCGASSWQDLSRGGAELTGYVVPRDLG